MHTCVCVCVFIKHRCICVLPTISRRALPDQSDGRRHVRLVSVLRENKQSTSNAAGPSPTLTACIFIYLPLVAY